MAKPKAIRNAASAELEISEPLPDAEFNFAARFHITCVLDRSGSMKGKPLEQLNASFGEFVKRMNGDHAARLAVEITVIAFPGKRDSPTNCSRPRAPFPSSASWA